MSDPITLQDFNDNFTVRIVDYKDMGNGHIEIMFEVKCRVNNRVSIFIADVDTSTLTEGYTAEDVTSTAWTNIKESINAWSSMCVQRPALTSYTAQSVSDDSQITLQDFNDNFTVLITRYELYPSVNPTSWCVAFNIIKKDKPTQNMYIDGTIPLTQHCNNVGCTLGVTKVWDNVKTQVCTWAAAEMMKASIIDTIYSPVEV